MNQKSLSHLEQQVMDIVWRRKECSVREAVEELRKTRKIAYTTVATIFRRLVTKGLLTMQEKYFAYIYSPKMSKESYSKKIANTFIKTFVHSFGDIAIASFAKSIDSLPKTKRAYFLKLLEAHDTTK